MMDHKEFFTVKDVASILNISEPAVYNNIKNENFRPYNKKYKHIHGGYRFSIEEVERIREEFRKPGLTTKDIADELGVSINTILKYIHDGTLPSDRQEYRGRVRNFVQEENFESFKKSFQQKKREKSSFYSRQTGYFLFQPFKNNTNNDFARIMEFSDGEGVAVTTSFEKIHTDDLEQRGYQPLIEFPHLKVNQKRGYATFTFPKPPHVKSPVYSLLEFFIKNVGPQNMKVINEDHSIKVKVKPTLIPLNQNDNHGEMALIQQHLTEGKLTTLPEEIFIDSDLEVVKTYIPSEDKDRLKKEAKELGMSLEEFVAHKLLKNPQ
ncbi:helix-turn-helix domain-containing protein [Desertibacillus haloalkaliphilus]|uniref:helix-turn-helix domain-containing protein n=1 Tax=Desertibacillus haloalkaliphilus TaxID=1328930 RepID=UPI001C26E5B1|nr:helix-turn-helix domain-containing protein [Desertibacillus haloalkaliphilus]MBU8908264.1 helix-turn-helix domain-containing protein [Desertibacillus haloalkaliphilus]